MHEPLCRCRTCKPPLAPLIAEEPTEMTFGQYVLIYAGMIAAFCGVIYFGTL